MSHPVLPTLETKYVGLMFFLNILNRPKGKKVENHLFEASYTRPGSGTRQVQLCQFVRLLAQLLVFLFLVDPEINPVA